MSSHYRYRQSNRENEGTVVVCSRTNAISSIAMPAIDFSLVKRGGNFASREPGVILVFAILGALGILIISLLIYKKAIARGSK
ncbi:hypothetical protein RUND412_003291 [Rhizina undulata]